MALTFKTIFLIYILVFYTDAGSDFDVDVFADTSDCMKIGRIRNGAVATYDMFPYLVSIQTSSIGQHLCGGTLLTPHHILTAAHCTFVKPLGKEFAPKDLQIRIGPSNLHLPAKIVAKVKWIKIHQGYRNRPIDNDIAVIMVDRPLTSREADIPCLSTSFIIPSPNLGPCITAGWGRLGPSPIPTEYKDTSNVSIPLYTNNTLLVPYNQTLNQTTPSFNGSNHNYNESHHAIGNDHSFIGIVNSSQTTNVTVASNISNPMFVTPSSGPSNVSLPTGNTSRPVFFNENHPKEAMLRLTLLPLQDSKECAKDYDNAGITNAVLCAGERNSETDTCKGDSGGPLVCNGKVEGIVSFGDGCDNPDHLGVYTRVYSHLGWIHQQIKSGSVSFNNTFNIFLACFVLFNSILSSI